MDNQEEQLQYHDTLSDLASHIQRYGVSQVAADFRQYFPSLAQDFGAALQTRYKPLAALLRP